LISIQNLSKSYGATKAVQNLNLELRPGEILGFLGPNGAGKTTTLKIIMGITQADAGEIRFKIGDGCHDPRRHIGYLPEETFVYDKLTGREFLQFVGRMQDVPESLLPTRIEDLLRTFEMIADADRLIKTCSKGMRRKIALCAALIHQPDILLLDEPTDGLDVMAIRALKDLLHRMKATGKAIVFSTHILAIAEEMCERFVILYKGQQVCTGTVEEFREQTGLYRASLEEIFVQLTRTFRSDGGNNEKVKNVSPLLSAGGT
jgi:ABC-2 type transport system ATP-binding protein